jgi:hypothetical protein
MTENEKAIELFYRAKSFADSRGHKDWDDEEVEIENVLGICDLIINEIISACEYNNVEIYNTDWWNRVRENIKIYAEEFKNLKK